LVHIFPFLQYVIRSRKRKASSYTDAWKPRARSVPRLYRTAFKRRSANRVALARSVNTRSDVHYFKRFAFKSTINPSPGDVAYGAMSFALDQLPAYTEFAALFDQYRVEKIDLVFSTRLDPSNSSAAAQSWFPRLFTLVDNDDTSVPSGADELRQSARCQLAIVKPDSFVKRSFVPQTLATVYNSGVSSGYALSNNTWLDMAVPSIPHYGMKYAIENLSTLNGQSILVEVSYHLAFRDSR